jgi:hypothetical protein
MSSSTRLRRSVAIAACGGLASALAWLPAGPASALGPATNTLTLDGNVNFSNFGPACSEVGTEPTHDTNFSHGSASDSLSMDTTVTNTDGTSPDPGDHTHVTGHISATGVLKKKHNGSMSSYKLSGTGKVSAVRAEGNASQCDVTASMTAETILNFTEAKGGWVYVTRNQAKNILSEMVIESDTTTPYIDLFGGPKSKNTERAFVKPGHYIAVSAFVVSSGPFIALKAGSPTTTLSGVFHAAGSALGGVRGTGGKFVKFPGSISCSHHSAKLTWTNKAGQVAAGSFFVNGHKKTSVNNPASGHSVVLRHLSKTADNKITAKLSLKGGGKPSATRAYVPCKG